MPPVLDRMQETLFFGRNTFTEILFLFMMFCIYPIVAEHFEMLFRDMDDQLSKNEGLGELRVSKTLFYLIGNCVAFPVKQKALRVDAHSREEEICRKRPRSARECAKAHSFSKNF